MSETTENQGSQTDEDKADELQTLKARADTMGLTYKANIGVDALRRKIQAHLSSDEEEEEDEEEVVSKKKAKLTKEEIRLQTMERMDKEERRLVRIRIVNMNPDKSDLPGEVWTVSNKYLGIVKVFVPYGDKTDNGWHVPNCIYKQLKAREFPKKTLVPNPKNPGINNVKISWVKEFSIEELPPLTPEELRKLAVQQAASNGDID